MSILNTNMFTLIDVSGQKKVPMAAV